MGAAPSRETLRRVLPLTPAYGSRQQIVCIPFITDFFPSEDCELFCQFYSVYTDPSIRYHRTVDIGNTASSASSSTSLLSSSSDSDCAGAEVENEPEPGAAPRGFFPAIRHTRSELYRALVLDDTDEDRVYESDAAMLQAYHDYPTRVRPLPCAVAFYYRCGCAGETDANSVCVLPVDSYGKSDGMNSSGSIGCGQCANFRCELEQEGKSKSQRCANVLGCWVSITGFVGYVNSSSLNPYSSGCVHDAVHKRVNRGDANTDTNDTTDDNAMNSRNDAASKAEENVVCASNPRATDATYADDGDTCHSDSRVPLSSRHVTRTYPSSNGDDKVTGCSMSDSVNVFDLYLVKSAGDHNRLHVLFAAMYTYAEQWQRACLNHATSAAPQLRRVCSFPSAIHPSAAAARHSTECASTNVGQDWAGCATPAQSSLCRAEKRPSDLSGCTAGAHLHQTNNRDANEHGCNSRADDTYENSKNELHGGKCSSTMRNRVCDGFVNAEAPTAAVPSSLDTLPSSWSHIPLLRHLPIHYLNLNRAESVRNRSRLVVGAADPAAHSHVGRSLSQAASAEANVVMHEPEPTRAHANTDAVNKSAKYPHTLLRRSDDKVGAIDSISSRSADHQQDTNHPAAGPSDRRDSVGRAHGVGNDATECSTGLDHDTTSLYVRWVLPPLTALHMSAHRSDVPYLCTLRSLRGLLDHTPPAYTRCERERHACDRGDKHNMCTGYTEDHEATRQADGESSATATTQTSSVAKSAVPQASVPTCHNCAEEGNAAISTRTREQMIMWLQSHSLDKQRDGMCGGSSNSNSSSSTRCVVTRTTSQGKSHTCRTAARDEEKQQRQERQHGDESWSDGSADRLHVHVHLSTVRDLFVYVVDSLLQNCNPAHALYATRWPCSAKAAMPPKRREASSASATAAVVSSDSFAMKDAEVATMHNDPSSLKLYTATSVIVQPWPFGSAHSAYTHDTRTATTAMHTTNTDSREQQQYEGTDKGLSSAAKHNTDANIGSKNEEDDDSHRGIEDTAEESPTSLSYCDSRAASDLTRYAHVQPDYHLVWVVGCETGAACGVVQAVQSWYAHGLPVRVGSRTFTATRVMESSANDSALPTTNSDSTHSFTSSSSTASTNTSTTHTVSKDISHVKQTVGMNDVLQSDKQHTCTDDADTLTRHLVAFMQCHGTAATGDCHRSHCLPLCAVCSSALQRPLSYTESDPHADNTSHASQAKAMRDVHPHNHKACLSGKDTVAAPGSAAENMCCSLTGMALVLLPSASADTKRTHAETAVTSTAKPKLITEGEADTTTRRVLQLVRLPLEELLLSELKDACKRAREAAPTDPNWVRVKPFPCSSSSEQDISVLDTFSVAACAPASAQCNTASSLTPLQQQQQQQQQPEQKTDPCSETVQTTSQGGSARTGSAETVFVESGCVCLWRIQLPLNMRRYVVVAPYFLRNMDSMKRHTPCVLCSCQQHQRQVSSQTQSSEAEQENDTDLAAAAVAARRDKNVCQDSTNDPFSASRCPQNAQRHLRALKRCTPARSTLHKNGTAIGVFMRAFDDAISYSNRGTPTPSLAERSETNAQGRSSSGVVHSTASANGSRSLQCYAQDAPGKSRQHASVFRGQSSKPPHYAPQQYPSQPNVSFAKSRGGGGIGDNNIYRGEHATHEMFYNGPYAATATAAMPQAPLNAAQTRPGMVSLPRHTDGVVLLPGGGVLRSNAYSVTTMARTEVSDNSNKNDNINTSNMSMTASSEGRCGMGTNQSHYRSVMRSSASSSYLKMHHMSAVESTQIAATAAATNGAHLTRTLHGGKERRAPPPPLHPQYLSAAALPNASHLVSVPHVMAQPVNHLPASSMAGAHIPVHLTHDQQALPAQLYPATHESHYAITSPAHSLYNAASTPYYAANDTSSNHSSGNILSHVNAGNSIAYNGVPAMPCNYAPGCYPAYATPAPDANSHLYAAQAHYHPNPSHRPLASSAPAHTASSAPPDTMMHCVYPFNHNYSSYCMPSTMIPPPPVMYSMTQVPSCVSPSACVPHTLPVPPPYQSAASHTNPGSSGNITSAHPTAGATSAAPPVHYTQANYATACGPAEVSQHSMPAPSFSAPADTVSQAHTTQLAATAASQTSRTYSGGKVEHESMLNHYRNRDNVYPSFASSSSQRDLSSHSCCTAKTATMPQIASASVAVMHHDDGLSENTSVSQSGRQPSGCGTGNSAAMQNSDASSPTARKATQPAHVESATDYTTFPNSKHNTTTTTMTNSAITNTKSNHLKHGSPVSGINAHSVIRNMSGMDQINLEERASPRLYFRADSTVSSRRPDSKHVSTTLIPDLRTMVIRTDSTDFRNTRPHPVVAGAHDSNAREPDANNEAAYVDSMQAAASERQTASPVHNDPAYLSEPYVFQVRQDSSPTLNNDSTAFFASRDSSLHVLNFEWQTRNESLNTIPSLSSPANVTVRTRHGGSYFHQRSISSYLSDAPDN